LGVGIKENEETFTSGFDASGVAKNCGAYSVPVAVFVKKDG